MSTIRRLIIVSCVVFGSLLAPLAATATWLRFDVLNGSGFSHHVEHVLAGRDVQEELGSRIVDMVTVPSSRASGADRALLEQTTRSLLAIQQVRDALGREVDRLHDELVDGADTLQFDIAPAVDDLRAVMSRIDVRLAQMLPADNQLSSVIVAQRKDVAAIWIAVAVARDLEVLLPLTAVAVVAVGALLSRRRPYELALTGAVVSLSCGLTLAAVRLAHWRVRRSISNTPGRGALETGWSAFGNPLLLNLRIGALTGVGLAGAAVAYEWWVRTHGCRT